MFDNILSIVKKRKAEKKNQFIDRQIPVPQIQGHATLFNAYITADTHVGGDILASKL